MKLNSITTGQIFEPLLQHFCEATQPIDIEEEFSTIFLPHTMTGYHQADKKIFYFGRDTNGWLKTSRLMQSFNDKQLYNYIDETSSWINKFGFLDYNKNRSSGFWTLAMRLHLRLKGITENLKIGTNLPDDYYELIKDFGYGNTNSIEVPASLKIRGIWKSLDKQKYWKVKEKSNPFDKLSHTIKSYKPDLIFIFNWNCDKVAFLEGLNYQEEKLPLISNHFLTYHLPDTDTKVIWTVHPTAGRFLSYGTDRIIDEIVEYLGGK